jgi:hypothetical protein
MVVAFLLFASGGVPVTTTGEGTAVFPAAGPPSRVVKGLALPVNSGQQGGGTAAPGPVR